MTLPKITKKQQEIILLIPRFRFLNRIQIQTFLNHKNKKNINTWLPDLVNKQYLERIYSTNFGDNTKPAVYYLRINGLRWLKTNSTYNPQQIRKWYQDKNRSEGFRDKCLLITDIYQDFQKQSIGNTGYEAITESDYSSPDSQFHFFSEPETIIHPNLVIKKTKGKQLRTWYLLEYFEETLPKYRVRKRLENYLEFYWSNEWENQTNDPFPIILLVFSTKADMIYAKRYTKKLLEEQDPETLQIRFTTRDGVRQFGVIGETWEPLA